jgi:uncharacterized membrane protein YbhN (UPF0104 family)
VSMRSPWLRVVLVVLGAAGAVAIVVWRGPAWSDVSDAFTIVSWRWVVAAIALNLASVVVRSVAWRTVIEQAAPHRKASRRVACKTPTRRRPARRDAAVHDDPRCARA